MNTNLTQKITIAGISLLVFNTAGNAEASIINGGFETGNFNGWSTIGDTSIETSAFGSGPTEGNFEALLTNGSISIPDSAIESFLGLTSGTLDSLSTNNVTEGSAIKQTFTAQAGDIVSFDWNFLTFEFTPTFFNDFAFVSLSSTEVLADTFSPFASSLSSFSEETGFNTFSFEIPASGNYTLGLGVMDVEDTIIDSGLLVDNVSVETTPEPASILGFLVVGGLGANSLKRKKSN